MKKNQNKKTIVVNKGIYSDRTLNQIIELIYYLVNNKIVKFAIGNSDDNSYIFLKENKEFIITSTDELEFQDEKDALLEFISLQQKEMLQFDFNEPYFKLYYDRFEFQYNNFQVITYPVLTIFIFGLLTFSYKFEFIDINTEEFINYSFAMKNEKVKKWTGPQTIIKKYYNGKNIYQNEFEEMLINYKYSLNNDISYERTTYYVDDEFNELNTIKLLYSINQNTKNTYTGPDLRLCYDYTHHINQLNTVITGVDATNNYSVIQTQEEFMLRLYINAIRIQKSILNESFNPKQLKEIMISFEELKSHDIYSQLLEVNEIILYFIEIMKFNQLISKINTLINLQLKDHDKILQQRITYLSLIFGSTVLIEYLLLPLIKVVLLKFNLLIDDNWLKLVISLPMFLILYFFFIVKRKKD